MAAALSPGPAETAGIRSETVERIRQRAESWVAAERTQSLCLVLARRGVVFLHDAWGPLTPEPDSPALRTDSLFPLASLTKPITVTAAMILVEDGLLGLNRPVQEYIPEFVGEHKDRVMVHHLMTHTSGIDDQPLLDMIEDDPDNLPEPLQRPEWDELMGSVYAYVYEAPLAFRPGEQMTYSNVGMYLVGDLVRRISGLPLEEFARQRIFEPLGMHDSYYVVPEAEQSRVALHPEDDDQNLNSKQMMERPSPSGGAYSTAMDMARFGQMYLNGGTYGETRILSRAGVRSMTRNQIPGLQAVMLDATFPEASWGLGWSVGHMYKGRIYGEELLLPHYFNHGGSGGVELWVDPESEVVGAYFSVTTERDESDFTLHHADLVMNMVAAGIETDRDPSTASAAHRPAEGKRSPGGVEDERTPGAPGRTEHGHTVARELRRGTPEEAGVSVQRLGALVERAKAWVESGQIPTLALYAARRSIVFLDNVFGRMGPDPDAEPLTRQALFPIASITKPIAATAVMMLVEEGLIGLNRQVHEYIPEFRGENKHRVTVRHLLTHTSGLHDQDQFELAAQRGYDIDPNDPVSAWPALARDWQTYLDLLYQTPLRDPPGQVMLYADANFELLGQIIEQASGMPVQRWIHERVFEPLGMADSFLPLPEKEHNRSVQRIPEAPGYLSRQMLIETGNPSTSTGAYSTAADLARFGQMMLNGGSYAGVRLLSSTSVAAMTRVQTPGIPAVSGEETFRESEWGLGWNVHHTKTAWGWNEPLLSPGSFSHSGLGGSILWVDPAEELVAVLLSVYERFKPGGLPDANHDLFINSLLAALEA